MNKIVRVVAFLTLSGIFLACKKTSPTVDPFAEWKLEGETMGRSGPGFSWRLSTDSPADGYFDLAGNRLFYLNGAGEYSREVTLTVTKQEETSTDPTFRIYGRFQQCLLMSTPTVSSGNFTGSGIFQRDGIISSAKYSGMTWTPSFAKGPVNSKATYKFKVFIDSKDLQCIEGFVQVDMVTPTSINSQGSYSDGDYLYFIKKM